MQSALAQAQDQLCHIEWDNLPAEIQAYIQAHPYQTAF